MNRYSFNAIVIVEFGKMNFVPGMKDIQVFLEKKGIVASKPANPGDPIVMEFKMDEVKK